MISNTNESRVSSARPQLRAALLGLAAWLVPNVVLASPNFPAVLQEELDLGCVPQCIICHASNYGGNQTANKPFAVTLQNAATYEGTNAPGPVVEEDDDSLRDAIAYLSARERGEVMVEVKDAMGNVTGTMVAAGIDSDGDDVDDIAELTELRDPSVRGVGDMCGPRYGCGARVEPRGSLDLASALAIGTCALGLGVLARRRSKERALPSR